MISLWPGWREGYDEKTSLGSHVAKSVSIQNLCSLQCFHRYRDGACLLWPFRHETRLCIGIDIMASVTVTPLLQLKISKFSQYVVEKKHEMEWSHRIIDADFIHKMRDVIFLQGVVEVY